MRIYCEHSPPKFPFTEEVTVAARDILFTIIITFYLHSLQVDSKSKSFKAQKIHIHSWLYCISVG